ncbi:Spy/CpxP family protein refolding chaperone [Geomonas sp. Red69]|uniref:Spy/CpxP family protein refolding chaperone n=1 Tax=Geomonas diazotrophica TaxID=2843197 RepID=A0ABX8JH65_9BACT|nr:MULTISPECIES: Spy/CpxP family protein refolding chaperone [Geomonas]MBU5637944.1 Spy/CpxP family protein refolding chaperone [Geomonas diazotrophica]QWV96481.1 Spy/CpxP family protein refolding chaperone [Geomonas nitrogeniifigens]QXE85587.1 Spy/CpxP family protein refolding chaperone [Geomonas nitrogeniifigens]
MKRQLRQLALFTCITATAALGAQSAFAGYGPAEGEGGKGCFEQQKHGGPRAMLRKMARELGLSEQQRNEARAIFEAGRAKNAPLFASLRHERHELQALVRSGSADEPAIRAQAAKVSALQADFAVQRGAQTRQFLALLTPEQAAKFKALREAPHGAPGHRAGHDR